MLYRWVPVWGAEYNTVLRRKRSSADLYTLIVQSANTSQSTKAFASVTCKIGRTMLSARPHAFQTRPCAPYDMPTTSVTAQPGWSR